MRLYGEEARGLIHFLVCLERGARSGERSS
jgi:hypothetical protein